MSGYINVKDIIPSIELRNEAQIVKTLTDADTWYIIDDVNFNNYLSPNLFTFTNGYITYIGTEPTNIKFWGESLFKVNSTDVVTYGLFVHDGTSEYLIPNMESKFDVAFANKTCSVGINGKGDIKYGDKLAVKIKCSTAGKILTIDSLHVFIEGSLV